mmetsp:Transcript_14078/g.16314  ORF Transcript_14078/g.16314 Transcript_14078/m.16314 type:complete len:178 (-) Transcript_14078:142-675(-)
MTAIAMVWVITNQLRLFLFFILSGAYLPEKVFEFVKIGQMFTFNFSFLPTLELPGVKQALSKVDFPQTNTNMEAIGVEYGSVIMNNFDLVFTVVLTAIFHLLFRLVEKCVVRRTKNQWVQSKVVRLIQGLEFGTYIRMFLEADMIVVASATSEITTADFSSKEKIFSFCVAFLVFVL